MRVAGVVVAVAGLAGLARAETRPTYGGEVKGSLLGAPVTFDPVAAQSHAEITVVGLVFDTLYAIGADGAAEPHLAVGPPVLDAARTTAHVALRRGVMFHDQTVMTAADVADSLERVRGRIGWLLAPVASVRVAGDGVDLLLRAPGVDVAPLLALPQTAITRRGQAPAAARPIGSGPFAVDGFDPAARRLVLRAFDDHFAGRPYLDRLELTWFDAPDTPDGEARRFETGVAQLSARGAAAFAGARPMYAASRVESAAALLVFVGFGRHHAVMSEPVLRQALDLALDRGALATITTGEYSQPTRLPVPSQAGAPVLDAAGRSGDPGKARDLLDAAGARVAALAASHRRTLTPLSILVDQTRPDDREIALRVSRGLDRLDISSTIEAVPPAVLRERVGRGDCDLWIGQIAAPVGLAAAWWGAAFAAGNSDWPRRALAAGALDPAAAAAEFARALPIVPLMFRSVLIWHRNAVHGLGFDASGRPALADLYWFKGPP
ncbi:MAG TPA: ABC transporter substrate-binding protein [Kofleriaceae bacterium]|jgi:MarR-like DNA-binding transcriptional regulator SgrR of sgrS sRNA|nr:ABC transporter substrate-binding protein [Kofleriaceae bacterium]